MRALARLMTPPPHPTVSEQLLEMLPALEHPGPVIEELAGLLSLGGTQSLATVVGRYTEALHGDRALLLPIIGSLFELPLTGDLAASAAALAREALEVWHT